MFHLNLLGSIHCFLVKFEENSDQKKYSYAQYNSRFILPDFSMTICLRLEFYINIILVNPFNFNFYRFNLYSETGDYNWLWGYSIELNPDKMNMCK